MLLPSNERPAEIGTPLQCLRDDGRLVDLIRQRRLNQDSIYIIAII